VPGSIFFDLLEHQILPPNHDVDESGALANRHLTDRQEPQTHLHGKDRPSISSALVGSHCPDQFNLLSAGFIPMAEDEWFTLLTLNRCF